MRGNRFPCRSFLSDKESSSSGHHAPPEREMDLAISEDPVTRKIPKWDMTQTLWGDCRFLHVRHRFLGLKGLGTPPTCRQIFSNCVPMRSTRVLYSIILCLLLALHVIANPLPFSSSGGGRRRHDSNEGEFIPVSELYTSIPLDQIPTTVSENCTL